MANDTLIKCIQDIKFDSTPTIRFNGTVTDIFTEGDGDKKPFKAMVRIEESGEQTSVFSWKWDLLPIIKNAESSTNVFEFVGIASLYKEEQQIKLLSIKDMGYKSCKKKENTLNVESIKNEYVEIIKTYFEKNNIYIPFIEELIINNKEFWEWPAATKIHHAYPGGLAKHTLNVTKNAISTWKVYNGENIDIRLLIAGAMLHDIGKLREYNFDGSRTIYGDLITHPVSGSDMITERAIEYGIGVDSHEIVLLKHVILSHHEKLEYGSPVQPGILEALIVARADALDSNVETAEKSLNNIPTNYQTERIMSINNTKLFKWHE